MFDYWTMKWLFFYHIDQSIYAYYYYYYSFFNFNLMSCQVRRIFKRIKTGKKKCQKAIDRIKLV